MLISIKKLVRFDSGALATNPFRAVHAVYSAFWRWRQQRLAASELHSQSDRLLRDIGISRSQIDERVRNSATRSVRPAT